MKVTIDISTYFVILKYLYFYNPHSYPNGFYWGYQNLWTFCLLNEYIQYQISAPIDQWIHLYLPTIQWLQVWNPTERKI